MLRRCVTLWVFAVLAVIGVACGSSPTATLSPGPPSPGPPSPGLSSPRPLVDPQEADALRELAFAYWEAFNAYDADKTLGYLEEEYRQQRDEEIRGEIGSIKLFGIKLGVSEETPPSIVSNDEREMYLTMKEPLGKRRIRMAFREVKGEWKIIFVEESK